MIQKKALLILLSLIALGQCENECSDAIVLKEACEKLKSESGKVCRYIGSACTSSYSTCEDYTGDDSSTCTQIQLNDFRYECIFDSTSTPKCTKKTKTCSDYTAGGKEICEGLSAGSNDQRCVYSNTDGTDKCEAHYNECSNLPVEKCPNNIPKDTKKKCVVNEDGNACESQERLCNEYLPGEDNCWNLKSSTVGKKCILKATGCEEDYKFCSDGSSLDEINCAAIQPYLENKNEIDYSHKCSKEGNSCIKKQKECVNYKSGQSDEYCTRITFENNSKKKCVKDETDCKESYLKCEGYTGNDEDTCKAIQPLNDDGSIDYKNKCSFTGSSCKTELKGCSDYENTQSEDFCISIIPSNTQKRCVFTSGSPNKCVEMFKKCEYYQENNKDECESIQPYNDENGIEYNKKCVYENSQCKTVDKTCEDAKDHKECESIILSDTERCYYVGVGGSTANGCTKKYRDCEYYKGNDRIKCESIKLFKKDANEIDNQYECKLEKDNKCVKKKKNKCQDYTGIDEDICANHVPTDPTTQICTLSGGKCIERYKYCSEYNGNTEAECTSIQPFDPTTNKIDYYSKCVLKDSKCVKEPKSCTDYQEYDANECSKHHSTNKEKVCALKGNSCTEEYAKCEDYNKNVFQTTCEGIILSDYTKKCTFTAADGSTPAKCKTEDKTCGDFNTNYIGNYCANHELNDYTKKCVFDSSCQDHINSCAEIVFTNSNDATEDNCNKINTGNEQTKCSLKKDKSGCKLVNLNEDYYEYEEKNEEDKKETQGGEKNSAGKKYQIIFAILVSLLLL